MTLGELKAELERLSRSWSESVEVAVERPAFVDRPTDTIVGVFSPAYNTVDPVVVLVIGERTDGE